MGRDPVTEPLSPLEIAIFVACLQEQWEDEISVRPDVALTRMFAGGGRGGESDE